MLIKFKDGDSGAIRRINTDTIVEVMEWPATPEHTYFDEDYNEERTARVQEMRLDIVTSVSKATHYDGGDYPSAAQTSVNPYTIHLVGTSARDVSDALDTISKEA